MVTDFRDERTSHDPTARQRDPNPHNVSDYRTPAIRFSAEKNELLGSFPYGLKLADRALLSSICRKTRVARQWAARRCRLAVSGRL